MINKIFNSKPLILAPMAGVTDFAFRSIAKDCGADLTCTEMISAKGLLYDSQKTKSMLYCCDNEKPKMVQLFGYEPKDFIDCIPYLSNFDIIDINVGCPAPKIFNNNQGSALLANPLLVYSLVKAVKDNSDKVVSAKIRLGINDKNAGLNVAKAIEDAGADFITVHGRSKVQGYSGEADLDKISQIKSSLKIKVVGNGDVKDNKSLNKMWQTGVDGVMIGRASLGNPEIFAKLKKQSYPTKIEIIQRHIKLLQTQFNNDFLSKYLRKHLLWYVKGIKNNDIKLEICNMTDVNLMLEKLEKFF